MKQLSILMLSIRPQNLIRCYNSIAASCKTIDWEIIIPSPYLIPEELMTSGNVRFIHTYDRPTVALQLAVMNATGEFVYNITDDGLLLPDAIDNNAGEFLKNDDGNILNMRYDEGVLDPHTLELLAPDHKHFEDNYWKAFFHPDLHLAAINPNWDICMHFLMRREVLMAFGGFDCSYEYTTYPILDMLFRAQLNGAKIIHSKDTAFYCSHLPCHNGDHQPVHDAQTGPDLTQWRNKWSQQDHEICIDFDNWRQYAGQWHRRFKTRSLTP